MKHVMRVIFIAIPLILWSACSSAQNKTEPNSTLENSQQDESQSSEKGTKIDFDNAVFIDVRTPGEYSGGTFSSARNIPLNVFSNRINELDKNEQIVVFCKTGGRASSALNILKNQGFTNVINGVNIAYLETLNKK